MFYKKMQKQGKLNAVVISRDFERTLLFLILFSWLFLKKIIFLTNFFIFWLTLLVVILIQFFISRRPASSAEDQTPSPLVECPAKNVKKMLRAP